MSVAIKIKSVTQKERTEIDALVEQFIEMESDLELGEIVTPRHVIKRMEKDNDLEQRGM